MALPIERWAKQAVLLEATTGSTDPVADSRVMGDVQELATLERQTWMTRQRHLSEGGDLVALYGIYAGLQALPPQGTLANVASISGEGAQWATASFTPINANALTFPAAWRFVCQYQVITSTSPASLTINPRLGAFAAGASTTGGVQLGANAAIALTASITSNWYVRGDITFTKGGLPGANSTAMGFFHLVAKDTTASNGAVVSHQLFGYTAGSFDSSITSGFVLGNANTVTTINFSTLQLIWSSWN